MRFAEPGSAASVCSTCCQPVHDSGYSAWWNQAAACRTMPRPETLCPCAQMSSAQLQVFSQAMGSVRDCIFTAQARSQGAGHDIV